MKSLLLAFTHIAICVAAGFAQESRSIGVLQNSGGRFVFGQVSLMRSDQYLLDTQTGRMWVMSVDKNNDSILVPIPVAASHNLQYFSPLDAVAVLPTPPPATAKSRTGIFDDLQPSQTPQKNP
jgi:hypothetical protein